MEKRFPNQRLKLRLTEELVPTDTRDRGRGAFLRGKGIGHRQNGAHMLRRKRTTAEE